MYGAWQAAWLQEAYKDGSLLYSCHPDVIGGSAGAVNTWLIYEALTSASLHPDPDSALKRIMETDYLSDAWVKVIQPFYKKKTSLVSQLFSRLINRRPSTTQLSAALQTYVEDRLGKGVPRVELQNPTLSVAVYNATKHSIDIVESNAPHFADAVAASASIPILFKPITSLQNVLVDVGIVDPSLHEVAILMSVDVSTSLVLSCNDGTPSTFLNPGTKHKLKHELAFIYDTIMSTNARQALDAFHKSGAIVILAEDANFQNTDGILDMVSVGRIQYLKHPL
jgi:predicted acylesterase/phospholipase RssA